MIVGNEISRTLYLIVYYDMNQLTLNRSALNPSVPPNMHPRGLCRAPLCGRTFKGTQGLRAHHRHSPSCDAWYEEQIRASRQSPPSTAKDPDIQASPLPWSSTTAAPPTAPAPRRNRPVTVEDDNSDDGLGVDGLSSDDEPPTSKGRTETYPSAAKTYGKGRTIMQEIDEDNSVPEAKNNVYYPFTSRQDFEMGAWLSQSNVSMSQIDDFLKLSYICSVPITSRYVLITIFAGQGTRRAFVSKRTRT